LGRERGLFRRRQRRLLDLLVTHYVQSDEHQVLPSRRLMSTCVRRTPTPKADLYRNNGDGTFSDETKNAA
jgi:hypothetical protein